MKKNYLSTGEFAKLCRTTKETLFHYDKEKLLTPKYVSENGYRYYGPEQFFEFDLISILKETGTALKQIRHYLENMEPHSLLLLLEEKRLVLRKEKEKLIQREDMLLGMMNCTQETLHIEYDAFFVQDVEEERLELFPTKAASLEPTAEFASRFAEYVEYYAQEERIPSYPYGVILPQEKVLAGKYLENFFFCSATQFTPEHQLHIKPKGKYAVLTHKGSVQTHMEAFENMLKQIHQAGMNIVGDAYVYDMMSVFLVKQASIHSSKYCIRVE